MPPVLSSARDRRAPDLSIAGSARGSQRHWAGRALHVPVWYNGTSRGTISGNSAHSCPSSHGLVTTFSPAGPSPRSTSAPGCSAPPAVAAPTANTSRLAPVSRWWRLPTHYLASAPGGTHGWNQPPHSVPAPAAAPAKSSIAPQPDVAAAAGLDITHLCKLETGARIRTSMPAGPLFLPAPCTWSPPSCFLLAGHTPADVRDIIVTTPKVSHFLRLCRDLTPDQWRALEVAVDGGLV